MTTISSLNNAALSLFKSTQPERTTTKNVDTTDEVKIVGGISTLPGAAYQQAAAAAGKFSVEAASVPRKFVDATEVISESDANETSTE